MTEDYDYSQPFRIRIIKDCRPEAREKLDGQSGFCLGKYENWSSYLKHSEKNKLESVRGEPLIRTDNGKYIWGSECWWAQEEWSKDVPLEKLEKALQTHKENICRRLGLEKKF